MFSTIRRVRVGDPITADLMNSLIDAANRAQLNVAQGCGLTLSEGPGGYSIGLAIDGFLWAKTTGPISGGTYPWTQQREDSGGAWTAGTLTDDAYEANGNASVPTGTIVKLYRTAAGDWRFNSDSC